MCNDVDLRIRNRSQQPAGLLDSVECEVGVDRGDREVQPGENPVIEVDVPVPIDVQLRPMEDHDVGILGSNSFDCLALPFKPLFVESSEPEPFGMIGDRYVVETPGPGCLHQVFDCL